MILGNLINPYFPNNLSLFYEHFITKLKIDDFAVAVGGEWYPYSGLELLTHLPVALVAMVVGYILFAPKNGRLPEKATFFLIFVTVLFALQFRSKRYAEYFPPFAILFAAFSWQAFRLLDLSRLPGEFMDGIAPYLDHQKTAKRDSSHFYKQAAAGILGFLLVLLLIYNFRGVNFAGIKQEGLTESIRNNEANTKYQRATDWLNENVPPGERIFNCNWDDFPKLFFYDQKHSYVYGLDPNYLYTKNPELSKRIMDITSGKVDDPAPEIRDKFGARYIFSDAKENHDFIVKALDSGWCETAYDDDEAIILKILDTKGNVPDADDESAAPDESKTVNKNNQNTEDEEIEENNTK
jgi:hypothetical protein